jgi:hypothetical protein
MVEEPSEAKRERGSLSGSKKDGCSKRVEVESFDPQKICMI